MNEIDIVRDISRRFEQAHVLYMLTGSVAMNYYAQPRMTRDIDVVIAISPDDVGRIVVLFRPDYYVSEESIRESLAHESIFNLIHQESVIKVDCIIRKSSEYRKTEFERRQRISVRDFTTFIVSKEITLRDTTGRCAKSARDWLRCEVRGALDARVETG
jgi:hypothetical protein